MPFTIANALLVLGGLGTIVTFILNFQKVVDWFQNLGAKKKAQPKLAVSVTDGSRSRFRANDRLYHPFDLVPGEALTWDQQQQLVFDYRLSWFYTINVTNQTEHTAYNVKLVPIREDVTFNIEPRIDSTIPFSPNVTRTFDIICRREYRCKPEEADAILGKFPFWKLQFEYCLVLK